MYKQSYQNKLIILILYLLLTGKLAQMPFSNYEYVLFFTVKYIIEDMFMYLFCSLI